MFLLANLFAVPIVAQPGGGLPGRTEQVADIGAPGATGWASITSDQAPTVRWFASINGRTFFQADDGIHGTELWVSDGSPEGTEMVVDLCPGVCSSHPTRLTAGTDSIAFLADDGESGREPWRSDGTEAGTFQLADLAPGPNSSRIEIAWLGTGWGTRDLLLPDPPLVSLPDSVSRVGGPTQLATGTVSLSGQLTEHGYFFVAKCPAPSEQDCLWRTQGSVASTGPWPSSQPLEDAIPNGNENRWAVSGDRLYLAAGEVGDPTVAWMVSISDGAVSPALQPVPDGTARLHSRLELGGQVYFFQIPPDSGAPQLAVTDGTVAGTASISLPSLTDPGLTDLWRAGSLLIIVARSDEHGVRVWSTDASDQGTNLLFDPVDSSEEPFFPNVYTRSSSVTTDPFQLLQFFTRDGSVFWSTTGTPGGSLRLTGPEADVVGDAGVGALEVVRMRTGSAGPVLYAVRPTEDEISLPTWWVTDGTSAGTQPVLEPMRGSSWPGLFHSAPPQGDVRFFVRSGLASELWFLEGSDAASIPIAGEVENQPLPARADIAITATETFYSVSELGGDPALHRVAESQDLELFSDEVSAGCDLGWLQSSPNQVLSQHLEGSTGRTWCAVNPQTGSGVLSNVRARQETWRQHVVTWQGTTFVSTSEGLWTVAEGDFSELSSAPAGAAHFASGESDLFFLSEDASPQLWVTDGTTEGTVNTASRSGSPSIRTLDTEHESFNHLSRRWFNTFNEGIASLATLNDRAFFAAESAEHGIELWSAARGAPPAIVKDLTPGPNTSFPRFFARHQGRLFFVANDGLHGEELWVSDGTEQGTTMLFDLNPGAKGSRPRELTSCGAFLCFSAFEPTFGRELWAVTTGADEREVAAQVVRLSDINPGSASSSPSELFHHEDTLYFAATDGVTGFEVWRWIPALFADGFEEGDLSAWQ